MTTQITFFVEGLPKPAGSKRGFAVKIGGLYTGRVAIVDASKGSKDWKTDIKIAARAYEPETLIHTAVFLHLSFCLPRPKGHYGTGSKSAVLRSTAPDNHTIKPDVLKLARAVEDALTGIIWVDDAQIVKETLTKCYCPTGAPPGVFITITSTPIQW